MVGSGGQTLLLTIVPFFLQQQQQEAFSSGKDHPASGGSSNPRGFFFGFPEKAPVHACSREGKQASKASEARHSSQGCLPPPCVRACARVSFFLPPVCHRKKKKATQQGRRSLSVSLYPLESAREKSKEEASHLVARMRRQRYHH